MLLHLKIQWNSCFDLKRMTIYIYLVVQVLCTDEKEATEDTSSTKSKTSLPSQYEEKIAATSSSPSARPVVGDVSADRLTLPSERSHKRYYCC